MPPTSTRPLVDRILGGRLAEKLTEWRMTGVSYAGCAARLYAEHAIEVTPETVRKWCDELDVPSPNESAA